MGSSLKLLLVTGARPNFMKVAPLVTAARAHDDVSTFLVHTGQHFDERMAKIFMDDLGLKNPDENLAVGPGTQSWQLAEIMHRLEPILLRERPDAVVVVGDVTSTLAAALVAEKSGIPVAHVEAGLRSFDRTMPEETNRILTDALSTWLFVSEPSGVSNLLEEKIPRERIFNVGNTMIDTLLTFAAHSDSSDVLRHSQLERRKYGLVTLHRPALTGDPRIFAETIATLKALSRKIPIVFPMHPRTLGVAQHLSLDLEGIQCMPPLGYTDFVKLMKDARFVITDSGGIQDETTVLGVPCLTLRDNTERPITVEQGTNTLVGRDPGRLEPLVRALLDKPPSTSRPKPPDLWDGRASQRIISILRDALR